MAETVYLIAKADRSWKNITQYQDERQQGRSTARNGAQVAGAGGTVIGGSYAASEMFPKQLGRPNAAARRIARDVKVYRTNQRYAREQFGKVPGEIKEIDRKLLRGQVKGALRRNPAALGVAGGAALAGVGASMWAGGRTKARRSEANIARLRRERAAKRR